MTDKDPAENGEEVVAEDGATEEPESPSEVLLTEPIPDAEEVEEMVEDDGAEDSEVEGADEEG